MSMSEDFVDTVVANLKVISMLRKNSKLCVKRGQLAIDRSDHFQGVRRWITKDSRDVTLMHIRNTISSALKITRALLPPALHEIHESHNHLLMHQQHQQHHHSLPLPMHMTNAQASAAGLVCSDLQEWTLVRVVDEMRNCEAGLQNLRTTYSDDSSTVAAVDVLAERLRANCDDIDSKLKARRLSVVPAVPAVHVNNQHPFASGASAAVSVQTEAVNNSNTTTTSTHQSHQSHHKSHAAAASSK